MSSSKIEDRYMSNLGPTENATLSFTLIMNVIALITLSFNSIS